MNTNLLSEIKKGNRRVLAKALTAVIDDDQSFIKNLVQSYFNLKKRAKIVSILGSPGAGKSSFINRMLDFYNIGSDKIGLLLVDPSNPNTGGAILGDRVRLSDHYLNDNFFIRSLSNCGTEMSTRSSVVYSLMVLAHYPFDTILVEAVGGGQSNTLITKCCDISVLVYDPHSGDSIQHLKSGVLDIVDVIVLSKGDLIPLENVVNSLRESLSSNKPIFPLRPTQNSSNVDRDLDKINQVIVKAKKNELDWFFSKIIFSEFISDKIEMFWSQFKDKGCLPDCFGRDIKSDFIQFLKENS